MNQKLDPRFLPLILVLVLAIPSCLSQSNGLYRNCSEPFQCGRFEDLRYPFYGGNRPLSCGYPGFELDCTGEDDPLITTASMTYRVLDVENSARTLKVSRDDLWNTICPPSLSNTTLNFSLFDFYSPADDQNITVYYGCPPGMTFPGQFDCSVNGIRSSVSFFITPATPFPQPVTICSRNISVRVNQTAAQELANVNTASRNLLEDALRTGFSISWSADDNSCRSCLDSGGACGYNPTSASFACHCANATFQSTCNGNTGNTNGTLMIPPLFLHFLETLDYFRNNQTTPLKNA